MSPTSPSQPASPSGPLSSATVSPTCSTASGSFQDWREPIRQGLISLESNICIRAMSPICSPTSPSPSFPITPGASGANDGNTPTPTPIAAHQIRRSARRYPASRLSPRSLASPFSNVLSVPRPQQPLMAAVPLTNQATPASASHIAPPDVEDSMSPPLITSTSPLGVMGHKLHSGDGKPRHRGNGTDQADVCGSVKKGTCASPLASDSKATGAPSRRRGVQMSENPIWQFWNQKCN